MKTIKKVLDIVGFILYILLVIPLLHMIDKIIK